MNMPRLSEKLEKVEADVDVTVLCNPDRKKRQCQVLLVSETHIGDRL